MNFVLCCDDDVPGRKAVQEFTKEWGIPISRAFTFGSVDESLRGKRIEGFLEQADMQLIAAHFGLTEAPNKSQIQLFFSEKLAVGERVPFSKEFLGRTAASDSKVRDALGLNERGTSKAKPRARAKNHSLLRRDEVGLIGV